MKVLGIISSLTEASARTRVLQFTDPLKKENINLTGKYYLPLRYSEPAAWANRLGKFTGISPWRYLHLHKTINRLPLLITQFQYDIIWQNRLIMPHHSFLERSLLKPVVFDFDDAIWIVDKEKPVIRGIEKAEIVFAGNDYLAEYAIKYNKNTVVVPTVIDTTALYPLKKETDHFTIGWIGTNTNFKYLEIVKPAITKFLSLHKEARFFVVSSEPPPQFNFDNNKYIFRKWDATQENEMINMFSIGIMPIEDSDFTKGKCSYKMLQYMACGKPVVVSPAGTNKKILHETEAGIAANSTAEWFDAFSILKTDFSFSQKCAENGRKLVESKYSVIVSTPIIAGNFKKIV